MSTTIASATIGFEHAFYGHFHPARVAWLRMGGRPAWELPPFGAGETESEPRVWVPERPETIFEDLLLMAAIHVLDVEDLVLVARRTALALVEGDFVDLEAGKDMSPQAVQGLRGALRDVETDARVIVSLFDGEFKQSAERMNDYPLATQVLVPA